MLYFFAVLLCTNTANAGLLHFDGNIEFHNDVIFVNFTLDEDTTNVRMWTDSFQYGTNFDVMTTLWDSSGTLLETNDDNSSINPATQTYYDSGFVVGTMLAGDYTFSVQTYANFNLGNNISDGFIYDNLQAESMTTWVQPSTGVNQGTYWSVWLDGASTGEANVESVPEPSTLAIFAFGIFGFVARRFKK
ncbi:MAG: PEP-CTERM sorting domain-containing protein [Alteromonadaceae bacterium]|nr:PEP-CTERM sorting domain-containing protein [Alteromonadaceae bacterium]